LSRVIKAAVWEENPHLIDVPPPPPPPREDGEEEGLSEEAVQNLLARIAEREQAMDERVKEAEIHVAVLRGEAEEERDRLGLRGLLPPAVQTLEEQAAQAYELYQKKASPLQKREYLMRIFSINRTLFFKVFAEHVEEMMPIVYDPVIAESIEGYSHEFIDPEYAVYLTENDEAQFKDILRRAAGDRRIRLIVVTDAEEILGIGDWGTNGVDISVGKLMVYTAAAGIDPACVLPVVLDVGTNRKTLLDDPLYLGVRKNRLTGDAYHRVVASFVDAAESLFPDLYLHFEDFGRDHATALLREYRPRIATFNDDVQGTGIISLAGILGRELRVDQDSFLLALYQRGRHREDGLLARVVGLDRQRGLGHFLHAGGRGRAGVAGQVAATCHGKGQRQSAGNQGLGSVHGADSKDVCRMGNADLARMSRCGTACRAHGASPGNRVVVPGRSVRDGKCNEGGGCR